MKLAPVTTTLMLVFLLYCAMHRIMIFEVQAWSGLVLTYLSMLFILQMTHSAVNAGQLQDKLHGQIS